MAGCLILATASNTAAQDSFVRVQVIDVGQADGILIRTPNHEWVLIDAGQDGLLADSLTPHFKVDTLELAIASHRHKDHIGGMDEVLYRVPTKLYLADTLSRGTDTDSLVRVAIDSMNVPVRLPEADTIEIDGVSFIFLPWSRLDSHNENNNSVVVRLEFGEFSMLLTGDAENRERNTLVARHAMLLDVDVLKASHHGSHNGTDSAWLAAVTPERVVISTGLNRRFRHPHDTAVAAYDSVTGGPFYCTNRHGTVSVYGSPDGRIRVTTQRETYKPCTFDGTRYDWLVWQGAIIPELIIGDSNLYRNSSGALNAQGEDQVGIEFSGTGVLLSANIYDGDGREVGILRRNHWIRLDQQNYEVSTPPPTLSVVHRVSRDTVFTLTVAAAPGRVSIPAGAFYSRYRERIVIGSGFFSNATRFRTISNSLFDRGGRAVLVP